ncbi:aminotransferase class V-fold PLP-dependent enzyme [Collinsella aerofaciens]|uniref:aminotransferase class V-fold PLP-dependent enzyme n=1 Tax=Collinsella aerofaciens TaxID=74426 RepID=UPI00292A3E1B|nr:aminotransferase class V-fold PLP-dependent enzyme [Collinsella aerofaciens]
MRSASTTTASLPGVNPNSLHSLGRKAAARLEVARREIARSFGARVRPSEIILTNGGTEANQLALLGLAEGARQRDRKRDRVIVSAIEHDSILDNLPLLRAAGFTVDLVQPCRAGYIEPAALSDLLGDDVALVSIMVANNETGVVQPIREPCRGRAYRGRPVPHRCHPGVSAHSARCHRAGS